jgi:hypothetical protein
MCCMLALYQEKDAWGNETCKNLSLLFPTLQRSDPRQYPLSIYGMWIYSFCLSRQVAKFTRLMGELTICTNVKNVTGSSIGNYSALHVPWADIWWYCGKGNLCDILPCNWTGTCALIQLAIPFTLALHQVPKQDKNHQTERATAGSFDNVCVYIYIYIYSSGWLVKTG